MAKGFWKTVFKGGFKDISASFKEEVAAPFKKDAEKVGKKMAGGAWGHFFKFGKTLKTFGKMAMGPINLMLSVMDSIGIAEPVLDILSGFLEIIGGAALEALTPALQTLGDVFSDPEFQAVLTDIGNTIGQVLSPILRIFSSILIPLGPIIQLFLIPLKLIAIPLEMLADLLDAIDFGPIMDAINGLVGWVTEGIGNLMAMAKGAIADVRWGVMTRAERTQMGLEWAYTGEMPEWIQGSKAEERMKRMGLAEQERLRALTGPRGIQYEGPGIQGGGAVTIWIDGNVYDQSVIDEMLEKLQFEDLMGGR